MVKKRFSKCTSILLAAVLLLGTISGLFGVNADNSVDLQSYVDAAVESGDIVVTNETTEEDYVAMLDTAFAPLFEQGYYSVPYDFYKVLAKTGAVETTNTYTEVLVPGEEGAVSMVAALVNDETGDYIEQVVTAVIEPEMVQYTFATVSNSIGDWSGNNTDGWKYNGGNKDKVVIPNEITKLKGVDWHSYSQIKCIVYGTGLTVIPEQHWINAEVISFKGSVTEIGVRAFYGASSLKYMRLPDTVTTIGAQAFWGNFKLESLYLPYGLQTIGYGLFVARNHTVDGLANSALAAGSGYIVPEIDIPSSVTLVAGTTGEWTEGGNIVYDYGAFYGAASDTKITFWTHYNEGSWGQYYWNDGGNKQADSSMASHIYARSWEDGIVWSSRNICTVNEVESLDATLSIQEVAARVAQKSANLTNKVYDSLGAANDAAADLLTNVKHAYGDATSMFDVAWEEAEFTIDSNGNAVNTLVVSDVTGGTETVAKIKVVCPIGVDFDSIFDSYAPTNDTTADSLKTFVQSAVPAGVEVEVSEFYLTRAEDGVKEVGSAYGGADNQILVPGEYGFVSAVLKVTKNGQTQYHRINERIDPVMQEYAFTTVSNDISVWEGNNTDGYRYVGPDVDKLVIPSSITKLVANFEDPWHNKTNIKCLVVGEGITTMPSQSYLKAEIVSFNGDVTTIDNNAFTYASNLKYMRLPETVTYIGAEALRGCTQLKSLYLPHGLKELRNDIFVKTSEDVNADGTLKTELGYNIPEITIPSTVTECWDGAFTGAASKTVITTLTNSTHWSWAVWKYETADESFAKNVYVRGYSQDALISNSLGHAWHVNSPEHIDDMTLSEAVARASQAAYSVTSRSYENLTEVKNDAQRILDAIKNSYTIAGLTSPVSVIWESDFAENANFYYVNVLVLSKGTEIANIPIEIPKSLETDVQGLLDASGFTASKATTADDVSNAVKALPEMSGITVDVVEFYNLAPFDGAIERGSTYAGAPTEDVVLVEGVNGAVSAILRLTAPNGTTTLTDVEFVVAPTMAIYSFASVSNSIGDWLGDNTSGWYYNGKDVDKLIIPDTITTLSTSYYPNWYDKGNYGSAVTPKCIVFGTGFTSLPTAGYYDAEVISFKEGIKLTSIGNGAFFGAANLKYIRMPDTVTSLGNEAFFGCTSMTQLYLSKNLKTIGSNLFSKANDMKTHNITDIVIPASVTSIGEYAFMGSAKACNIVIASRANTFTNANSFYDSANSAWGANNTIRVHRMNDVNGSADMTFNGNKVYLDTMSLAEATARAMQKASLVEGTNFKSGSYANDLIATGYFGVESVSSAWKNADWTTTANTIENDYMVTKNGRSTVFHVSFNAEDGFYFEQPSILNTADFQAAGGQKQKIAVTFKFSSQDAAQYADKIDEFDIIEYGVIGQQVKNNLDDASFTLECADEEKRKMIGTFTSNETDDISFDESALESAYTVAIINIPQGARERKFQLRGYIKYENASGEEVSLYSDSFCYSVVGLYENLGGNSSASLNGMTNWMYGTLN